MNLTASEDPLLSIERLYIDFVTEEGIIKAVDDVDLDIQKGETLCL